MAKVPTPVDAGGSHPRYVQHRLEHLGLQRTSPTHATPGIWLLRNQASHLPASRGERQAYDWPRTCEVKAHAPASTAAAPLVMPANPCEMDGVVPVGRARESRFGAGAYAARLYRAEALDSPLACAALPPCPIVAMVLAIQHSVKKTAGEYLYVDEPGFARFASDKCLRDLHFRACSC